MPRYANARRVYAWAMYDWANSAYATTVMAGFFPLFFKQYWASGMPATESTFWLGSINALAALIIALLAPLLGAMADRGGIKKRMLLSFTAMAVVMTAALFLVAQGAWGWALGVYFFGAVAFSGANVFYDALLVEVAEPGEFDRASALGYGLGYIGGGLLFLLNVVMTLHPQWFALANKAAAVRWSFLSVAIWWAVFSLPLACMVREQVAHARLGLCSAAREGFGQLAETFAHVRRWRNVWLFLLAYFFYIDGVNTVARMAIDYGLALGFSSAVLMKALLLTQFVAFPAAIAMGWLGERWGAKRVLLLAIAVYALACLWSSAMQHAREFYVLAAVIGLVMGGIQSLSRSLYARMIPRAEAAEFFGFFNMLGKFSAVAGPALMGLTSLLSGSNRMAILAILLLFALGAALLLRVREP